MKRTILTAIVVASFAAPLAVPAIAAADSTTSYVARAFSTQIHNRARVSGFTVTATSVRCASDGGGYYSCWATFTALVGRRHAQYGAYLNITPTRWYVVGNGRLLRVW